MKDTRGKILLSLVLVLAIAVGLVVYLVNDNQTLKLKPWQSGVLLTTGELIQRGFDKDCQSIFNKTAQDLKEFEDRVVYQNGELDKVSMSAALRPVKVSHDTFEFVKGALDLCKRVDNKYDITIGTIRELWGFSSSHKTLPKDDRIAELVKAIDNSQISLDEESSTIMMGNLGAKLDFFGYLDGYLVDLAIHKSKEDGLKTVFAALGDTAASFGDRPDSTAYAVAIKEPQSPSKTYGSLKFENEAVSSCGVYTNAFELGDQKYWDILDPKTGRPANSGLKSVTVVAPNAKDATVLSRALFVNGKDYVKKHLNDYKIIAIDNNDNLLISDNISSRFERLTKQRT